MPFSQSGVGMKIYDQNPIGPSSSQTGRAQETQPAGRSEAARSSNSGGIEASGDHVEFSGTLSRLSKTLGGYASSRAEHVRALAEQYQAGRYVPSASAASRGMVSEMLNSGPQ